MTRVGLNNLLWIVSLLLQCALLMLFLRRRLLRRLPSFAILLGFYPLRSTLLFMLFDHVDPARYASVYTILSIADLAVQLCVAVEIAARLFLASDRRQSRRYAALLAIPGLAWAAALTVRHFVSQGSPVPPDRLQMFFSSLMLPLLVWACAQPASALVTRVTLGLALQGSVSLFATAGRTSAVLHRDASSYAFWAYLSSLAYLLIVLFWILTLKRQPDTHTERAG